MNRVEVIPAGDPHGEPTGILGSNEHNVTPRGRRVRRMVRFWENNSLKADDTFKTYDGAQYAVHPCGAFVNLNKDRRSVKERKRARRLAREIAA